MRVGKTNMISRKKSERKERKEKLVANCYRKSFCIGLVFLANLSNVKASKNQQNIKKTGCQTTKLIVFHRLCERKYSDIVRACCCWQNNRCKN